MARRNLTLKAYIKVDGKKILWYEIDEKGKVTWHLPKEEGKRYKEKMLKNVSEEMSRYAVEHPETL